MVINKPLLVLVSGGAITASTLGGSSYNASLNDIKGYSLEAAQEIQKKLENLSKLVKVGTTDKELKDVIKEYTRTLSGARHLSEIMAGSILVDLVENSDNKASAIRTALKGKLDSVRLSSSSSDSQKVYSLFGGEAAYKSYHVLKSIKKLFIDELINNLSEVLSSATGDLKSSSSSSSSSDELIKSALGEFYDAVLDDYIKYNKPLFVKKVFWKYSAESQEDKAKKIYESDAVKKHLPSNFTPPNVASYFFPVIESTSKWSSFVDGVKDGKEDGKLHEYTDDTENTHIVIPASVVEDFSKTSQFVIAYLELLGHGITFEKWKDSGKGTEKDNLSTKKEQTSEQNWCKFDTDHEQRIPSITFDKLSSDYKTDLSKLFCLEDSQNPLDSQKAVVNDFVYLKKSTTTTTDKPSNWILFKDKNGVHAWGIGQQPDASSSSSSEIKKKLIEAAKNKNDNKKFKFDMEGEFRYWLNNHFERLILSKWNKNLSAVDSTKSDGGDLKDIASGLKDVLEACVLQDSLIRLRKNVVKDYAALLNNYGPIQVAGETKHIHPNVAWAGRFPYKANNKALKNEKKLNEETLVFDYLESVYLSKYEKLSSEDLSFETGFESKVNEKKKEVDTKIDSLFSTNEAKISSDTTSVDGATHLSIKAGDSATTEKAKNSALTAVLDNLWVSMVHDGVAADYLTQSNIQKYLKEKAKLYKDEDSKMEDFKTNPDIKKIQKDSFKELNEEFSETLQRNYLLSKVNAEIAASPDPTVYGKILGSKISDFKDYSDLKKLVTSLRTVHGDEGFDILSPGNKDLFMELIAIEYLSKDSLSNYRKILKSHMPKDSLASFVFTKKYDKGGICDIDESKIEEALKLDINQVWSLNNRFMGYDISDSSNWKEKNCLTKSDIADFAFIRADESFTDGNSSKTLAYVGYKGLLMGDELSKLLPGEIFKKISKKLAIWGDAKHIVSGVKDIKTDKGFEEFLQKLKDSFPDLYWNFVELKEWVNPNASYYSSSSGIKLTLEERKKILIGFICNTSEKIVEANASLQWQYDLQKKWTSSSNTDASSSFLSSRLTRQNGFFEHNNSKILLDNDGNKHLVYMVQVRYDDLASSSWKSFLKEMNADLIAKDLVQKAMDKSVQQKALYYLLNEKDSDGIERMSIQDSRLDNRLDSIWKLFPSASS